MGKPTTAKASAIEAEKIAVEYLKKQNRPYNSTDIFNNLKGAVSKTALLKVVHQAS
jgi:26S proteasome regulatory subunit (ATPase 3-interacting protein)